VIKQRAMRQINNNAIDATHPDDLSSTHEASSDFPREHHHYDDHR
jgi:hypothetical protein